MKKYLTISSSFTVLFYPFNAINIFISLFIFLNFTFVNHKNTWLQQLYHTWLRIQCVDTLKNLRVLAATYLAFTNVIGPFTDTLYIKYLQIRF